MKKIFSPILLTILFAGLFSSCEKDLERAMLVPPASVQGFSASANQIVLTSADDGKKVIEFTFKAPEYGANVATIYTLQFAAPSDTLGATPWKNSVDVKLPADSVKRAFLGKDLNSLVSIQLGMPTGSANKVAVRLKSEVSPAAGEVSTIKPVYSTMTITVTPYKAMVIYPALVVKGGNSWITPPVAERADGFVLTSSGFNSKYEGYLNLPNADGFGGDAFKLISSTDQKEYGWGGTSTKIAVGGGNLYLTPAPAYLKVNVDLAAGTINFTPVKFYVTGDDNTWSTSATPLIYDPATKVLKANNVSLTAGKKIVFTANGSYDINYKVNAEGKLVFAGAPGWGASVGAMDITVPKTGVFTVTMDLSKGDGNYTYSIK
jgi:hypothetical protein